MRPAELIELDGRSAKPGEHVRTYPVVDVIGQVVDRDRFDPAGGVPVKLEETRCSRGEREYLLDIRGNWVDFPL